VDQSKRNGINNNNSQSSMKLKRIKSNSSIMTKNNFMKKKDFNSKALIRDYKTALKHSAII